MLIIIIIMLPWQQNIGVGRAALNITLFFTNVLNVFAKSKNKIILRVVVALCVINIKMTN